MRATAATDARRWRQAVPTVAGFRTAAFALTPGAPPQALVWIARIVGGAPYYGKGCCVFTEKTAHYYKWEAVWSNDWSQIAPMPVWGNIGQPFGCLNELPGWPNVYTYEQTDAQTPGLSGSWAINTAEFDISTGLNRQGAGGLAVHTELIVPMSIGYFTDTLLCPLEPRSPRYIPYFCYYGLSAYNTCL